MVGVEVSGGAVANLILVNVLLMKFDFLDHPDRRRVTTRGGCCSSVTLMRRRRRTLGTGARTTLTGGGGRTTAATSSSTLFFGTVRKASSGVDVRGGMTRVAFTAGNKHMCSTALGRCVTRSGGAPVMLFSNSSTSVGFGFCGGRKTVRTGSCFFRTIGGASDDIAVHLTTSDTDCVSFVCALGPSDCLVGFRVGTANVTSGLTDAGCMSVS